jgi:regulator of protease activity HflC (stomatin/prohibitin superfamily)
MPLIMSNEDVRLKVIKVYDEIVQSLKRQLDEATRMREEIRRDKKREEGGKIIEEGEEEKTKKGNV